VTYSSAYIKKRAFADVARRNDPSSETDGKRMMKRLCSCYLVGVVTSGI
jgi:hypothetical protein